MPFIHDDFLLTTETARRLYHDFAENEPILDYHTHLSPKEIATNHRFENLAEIWLGGDHYKWRAMRANGIDEQRITGDADPYDKYLAWAETVPRTLRNPLYHWTHLELKRYFDIEELLGPDTAESIWKRANERLASEDLSAHGILKKFNVKVVCTTDDPVDDLAHHREIANGDCPTEVYPTFRPDRALWVDRPDAFNPWVSQLATAADIEIADFDAFLNALDQRHAYFHEMGGRLSDHDVTKVLADACSQEAAAGIFANALKGKAADADLQEQFGAFMMLFFGRLDAKRGWTKQLHIGALRNNSTRLMREVGADAGCDSIGDMPSVAALSSYLDQLDQEDALPQTILYNLNPSANFSVGSVIGNFQDGRAAGKLQWGAGWWFNDQWDGMTRHLDDLSNLGLLSRFVGMLTDSRSLLSYPRHEYYRRCLCELLGSDIERGALPRDMEMVGSMVRDLCYGNARDYLGLGV
ncbi:glucuronate isomerase [Adhaeretor mobilis]|nr:glucuronate isomerase [Adhaeretor mobilis]